jgi:hypothetical protein
MWEFAGFSRKLALLKFISGTFLVAPAFGVIIVYAIVGVIWVQLLIVFETMYMTI